MQVYIRINTKEVVTEQALLYFINYGRKRPYKTIKNALKFCGYGQEFIACDLTTFDKMKKYFNNKGVN